MASKPMCCVHIGYAQFLLPSDAGLKIVALMQQAVECETTYVSGAGDHYVPGDPPRVSFSAVQPRQIHMPEGAQVSPAPRAAIARQSLRLPRKD